VLVAQVEGVIRHTPSYSNQRSASSWQPGTEQYAGMWPEPSVGRSSVVMGREKKKKPSGEKREPFHPAGRDPPAGRGSGRSREDVPIPGARIAAANALPGRPDSYRAPMHYRDTDIR
jgi:hypothetical protein